MNILLIGNGFDLAHGLPTSYKDFLTFCRCIKYIYNPSTEVSKETFETYYLEEWDVNDSIRNQLREAFDKREMTHSLDSGDKIYIVVNDEFDELYSYIRNNAWIDYFLECPIYIGQTWIDFETEISRVVQLLDLGKRNIEQEGSILGIKNENASNVLLLIAKTAQTTLQTVYRNVDSVNRFGAFLYTELERLICALEKYISVFVGSIKVCTKSEDIQKINPDCILSFNYSNTYERIYFTEKKIEYDYIHGKAKIDSYILTNNMVLGIEEYLPNERKDMDVEFIEFKKYYQRIYKKTGCKYKEWVDIIKKDETKKEHGLWMEKTTQETIAIAFIYMDIL